MRKLGSRNVRTRPARTGSNINLVEAHPPNVFALHPRLESDLNVLSLHLAFEPPKQGRVRFRRSCRQREPPAQRSRGLRENNLVSAK